MLEWEFLVTPGRIRACASDKTFRGVLALVTRADFLICVLMVVTLELNPWSCLNGSGFVP
jgi:hypothetical protein